jgi:hypothetical protein
MRNALTLSRHKQYSIDLCRYPSSGWVGWTLKYDGVYVDTGVAPTRSRAMLDAVAVKTRREHVV